jgi:hypothetical protein
VGKIHAMKKFQQNAALDALSNSGELSKQNRNSFQQLYYSGGMDKKSASIIPADFPSELLNSYISELSVLKF